MLSHFICVQLNLCPWIIDHQASMSVEFSRQEYWSGLPCLPPEDLPDLGIKLECLMSLALAGKFFTTSTHWEAHKRLYILKSMWKSGFRCKLICLKDYSLYSNIHSFLHDLQQYFVMLISFPYKLLVSKYAENTTFSFEVFMLNRMPCAEWTLRK